jgi:hypothetical protein
VCPLPEHDQRLIPPAELITLFRGDPFTGKGEEWAGVMPVILHSSFILHPSSFYTGGAWRLHGFRRSRVAGPARSWGFPLPNG